MNMVENIIDLILDKRIENNLDELIEEKGITKLEKKAAFTENIHERDDIIYQIILEVMGLGYKMGFKDSVKLFFEMTNIRN